LNHQLVLSSGRVVSGVIVKEDSAEYHVVTNLLIPQAVTRVRKSDVEEKSATKISPMPAGLVDALTQDEIHNLLSFLEVGGYQLPEHLKKGHGQDHGHGPPASRNPKR
jgi:hypothetical protein